jgi:succinate-semialdehyde dehydrogenase/glutarate-semialdehyde dehydrogenase
VKAGVASRYFNAGQTCLAAKRFIVDVLIADEFEERFCAAVGALKMGDPQDPTNNLGPLARKDVLEDVQRQVYEAIAAGAALRAGGHRSGTVGYFYEPTVLTSVTAAMSVFREETFGPVAAITRVNGDAEAVRYANDTPYGLCATVWTADEQRGLQIGRDIEAGSVFINGQTHSDVRLPFGGTKRSGYGRDLGSYGIREFAIAKTVWRPASR